MLADRSIQANAFSDPIVLTQCSQSASQSVQSVQLSSFSRGSVQFNSAHSELAHPRVCVTIVPSKLCHYDDTIQEAMHHCGVPWRVVASRVVAWQHVSALRCAALRCAAL